MPTVRRVPDSDMERYRRLINYAFHPEDGPQRDREIPDRLGDRFGVYDDDRLVTTGALYEFEARLRGEWVGLGGIAAVSSPPESRGSGYVRRLCRELLAECRNRGIALCALWPFSTPFYRQFGWAVANKFTVYEAPPDRLASAGTTDGGEFEPVGADDWDRLRPVQLAHTEGVTLSRRRSEGWWRGREFDRFGDRPWAYAWRRDDEIRGYVLYQFEGEDTDGRTLRVHDLSAVDQEARRHLLGLLGTHGSQVATVKLYSREESALLDAVDDPGEIECTIDTGPMVRISDVPLALETCSYPPAVDATVVMQVDDEFAGWNQGRVELSVGDGTATVEPTTDDADVTVDIGTLSQLLVGYRSAKSLRRTDGLDCGDETAALLEELFPTETVCLREFF